jgi:hypothetical protein
MPRHTEKEIRTALAVAADLSPEAWRLLREAVDAMALHADAMHKERTAREAARKEAWAPVAAANERVRAARQIYDDTFAIRLGTPGRVEALQVAATELEDAKRAASLALATYRGRAT